MSALALRGVTKTFGATVALDDVSLEVDEGELIALLGPSGCGKSTLLRVAAGLAVPEAGRVVIGGQDVTAWPTRTRPIGMVFQSYSLFPTMTVADNVGFPLEARRIGKDRRRARVAELLDLVDLARLADRYPNQLSGGQQQRVALARALAAEPAVLLLDEPLSALDAVLRVGLREEIRRVQQQVGVTALFVTHDQAEAMAVADRVAMMADGRIVELDTPAAIYERPRSQLTAEFVGSRNAMVLPVGGDRMARWGDVLSVPAPAGANGSALVLIRPEDLRLDPSDVTCGVPGVVELLVFQGATTRVLVEADGARLRADVPSRQAARLSPGQTVRVSVHPEGVVAFSSSSSSSSSAAASGS